MALLSDFETLIDRDCLSVIFSHIKPGLRCIISMVNRRWRANCKGKNPNSFFEDATQEGSLNLIIWARRNGARIGRHDLTMSVKAAEYGQLGILKWMFAQGLSFDRKKLCAASAKGGSVETLAFLREMGCEWDYVTNTASLHGHLPILIYARANGCGWYRKTCSSAAASGHLEILKWLRSKGCPWSSRTCAEAAKNGHLEVLVWSVENGGVMDIETCNGAVEGGHLSVLIWAKNKGAPMDRSTFDKAVASGRKEIIQWLKDNKCPM